MIPNNSMQSKFELDIIQESGEKSSHPVRMQGD